MARNITSYYVRTRKVSPISDNSFTGFTLGRPVKNKSSIRANLNVSRFWRVPTNALSAQSDRKSQDPNNTRLSSQGCSLKAICVIAPTQRVVKHGSHASLSNSLFCAHFAPSWLPRSWSKPNETRQSAEALLPLHTAVIAVLPSYKCNVQSVAKNAKNAISLQSLTPNISKVYYPTCKIFCNYDDQVMLYQSMNFDSDSNHSENAILGGMWKTPSPNSGVSDMRSPKTKVGTRNMQIYI